MEERELNVILLPVLVSKSVLTKPSLIFLITWSPCWATYIVPSDVMVRSTGLLKVAIARGPSIEEAVRFPEYVETVFVDGTINLIVLLPVSATYTLPVVLSIAIPCGKLKDALVVAPLEEPLVEFPTNALSDQPVLVSSRERIR